MANATNGSHWAGMLLVKNRWQSLRRAWAQRFNLDPTQTGHDVGAGLRLTAVLIAYLSFCILVVAMIGPAWCKWLVLLAILGFTLAIGMYKLGKSRTRVWRQKWQEKETQIAVRSEQRLDKAVHRQRSTEAIRKAVYQIVQSADDAETQRVGLGDGTRFSFHKRVKVMPLPTGTKERPEDSFVAYVRDISASGIGLMHEHPLEQDTVLLDFEAKNNVSIRFAAELLWCKQQADGRYFSGGKLTELATPVSDLSSENEPGRPLVASFQEPPGHLLPRQPVAGGQHDSVGKMKESTASDDSRNAELAKDMPATESTLSDERFAEGRGLSRAEEAPVLGKGNWKEVVLDAIKELPENLQASIGYFSKSENVMSVTVAGEHFSADDGQSESWVSEVVITYWNSLHDRDRSCESGSICRAGEEAEEQAEWPVLSIGGEAEVLPNGLCRGHASIVSFKRKVQAAILEELRSRSGERMTVKSLR